VVSGGKLVSLVGSAAHAPWPSRLARGSVLADAAFALGAVGGAADQIKQECTHPLHSGHGRMLRDHLISCYVLAKQWGMSEKACNACMFHALYERADGMRAADYRTTRPKLQAAFGDAMEELCYYFPSAHASIYREDGLLHQALDKPVQMIDFATKEPAELPEHIRVDMTNIEFINGYDQSFLEDEDPVQNMWAYYQHANILPLLVKEGQRAVMRYRKLGGNTTIEQIREWHEGRFKAAGKDIEADKKWGPHIQMFRPGGKYYELERRLNAVMASVDSSGDGEVQIEEFVKLAQVLKLGWTQAECRAKFNELDMSGDGNLDRTELDLWFIPLFNKMALAEVANLPRADALNAQQMDFTAERLSGFSRNMIEHIFDEVDMDGSGTIELDEMPFLARYLGESWDMAEQKRIMEVRALSLLAQCPQDDVPCAFSPGRIGIGEPLCSMCVAADDVVVRVPARQEIDTDGSGEIDSEEFYNWWVANCVSDDADNGVIKRRSERLQLGMDSIPQNMLDLLKEYGTGT